MIVRDLRRAADEEFDLVVVGGGIYGASLLREAARRGVSACLCEAQDFGGVTSQNSLRILHGGDSSSPSRHAAPRRCVSRASFAGCRASCRYTGRASSGRQ